MSEPLKPDYKELKKTRFWYSGNADPILTRAIWLEGEAERLRAILTKIGCLKFRTATCKQVGYDAIYWCEVCKLNEEAK